MKKMMLIAALIGFTAIGSYAQDKACPCKKKVTNHKMAHKVIHKKPICKTVVVQPVTARTYEVKRVQTKIEPCFAYRKNNIKVTQCPGTFYDNSDIERLYEFKSSNTYGGYYPAERKSNDVTGPMAPQHTTIDNYRGVAPAGGNGCNYDCDPQ